MWDMSNFDTSTSAGGGGFLNGTNDLQSPSGKKDQVRRTQSVVPLVARQILECEDEDFKLFGLPVQIAYLVGILRNFEVQSTKATCTIEDHTGEMNAVLWLASDDDGPATIPNVKEGSYVQVFGSIRRQEGTRMIMILKMIPVDDCNVITSHLLSVIHARLGAEAMSQRKPGFNAPGAALATSMSVMDTNPVAQETTGLNAMQEKVFRMLAAVDTASGISRTVVLNGFPKHQEREVNQALEFLVGEGHAYSTIDNDHFKATGGI